MTVIKTLFINTIPVAKYQFEKDSLGNKLFLKDLKPKQFESMGGIPEDTLVNLISGVEEKTFDLLGFLNI